MKKRMLALALALTIIVGLGGQAWAEVLPDLVSPSPEVSAQPEDSASPEVSETPEETTAPEETDVPEETDTPEETTSPEETEAPAETEAPEETEEPQDSETQEEPSADVASNAAALANAGTIDTVSPVGTTINLFDYWYSSQGEKSNNFNHSIDGGAWGGSWNYHNWATGINEGHALKFSYNPEHSHVDKGNAYVKANGSTPYSNMVMPNLVDGYPVLNPDTMTGSITRDKEWTASWPWDPDPEDEVRDYSIQFNESLEYLFNPAVSSNGKASYPDVKGLLTVDQDGYYSYNCKDNFASFRQETNSFTVYDTSATLGLQDEGAFLPFNDLDDDPFVDWESNSGAINHWFGLTVTTRFVQKNGGHTQNNKVVTYEFAGDDDVWVFIDGVLVGDLGGIHSAASLKIDFSTGEIYINNNLNGTLEDKFRAAGKNTDVGFNGETFADDTYHTLQFFYLERGAGASNLMLKFNLVSVPESSIYKVDQTGNAVAGAGFELHAATSDYTEGALIADGTTDSEGRIILLDDEGFTIGFQDLWNHLQDANLVYTDGGVQRANLLLKETSTPAGYRSGNTQKLYLVESGGNILMLSEDPWSNGTYSYTNSTVSMDGHFKANNNREYDLATDGGTLFAVVLRRDIESAPETDKWYLMTGGATEGWKQSENPINQDVQAVLNGVRGTQNYYVMRWDPSGSYKTTISNLPGDIMKYYYMLDAGNKGQAEYNIAFYYTTGSMGQADSSNTWMVQETSQWGREFSSNVYVPNVKNRLFVQKLSPEGEGLAGAEFTLYADNYYLGDGSVNPDATVVDRVTTQNFDKATHGIDLAGGGVFPKPGKTLNSGTYYVVETKAPANYTKNARVTKVVVDETGVYADAGEVNDGIVVARGVGSIVKSMAQFASLGDIDVTLNNIVAKFYTVPSDTVSGNGNFESFTWRNKSGNTFVPANGVTYHPSYMYSQDTGLELYNEATASEKTLLGLHMQYSAAAGLEYDPGQSIVAALGEDALHWMTTDTGWSKLMMEQCYTHSQELAQKEGRDVTDLTNPLMDLTNLFSGTVIVQVTDQHTTSLTITKDVTDAVESNVANQTYSFTVKKMNATGEAVDTGYTGSVQVKVGDTAEWKNFAGGELTVSRDGVGDIQILNLANGSYTVTENEPSKDPILVGEDNWYWQKATYQEGQNVVVTDTGATATVNSNVAEEAAASMTVLNVYQSDPILTVTKTVSGNMGDTVQDFTFTLAVSKEGTGYTQDIVATRTEVGVEGSTTVTLETANSYTFTLKHNQTITMEIPYGYDVTVTETTDQGYTTKSCQYPTDGTAVEPDAVGKAQTILAMQANTTVKYLNTRTDTDVTITGVDTSNTGISVMMGVAAASAVIIFGCSFLMWRRRRRDWM